MLERPLLPTVTRAARDLGHVGGVQQVLARRPADRAEARGVARAGHANGVTDRQVRRVRRRVARGDGDGLVGLENGHVRIGPGRLGDDEAATDADDGVRRGDLGHLARPQAALVDLEGELAALEIHARAHRIVDDRHDRAFPDGHGDAAAHEDADDGLLGGLDAVTHEYVVADLRGRALGVPRVGDRPLADERGDGADGLGLGGGERRGAEHQ